MSIGGFAGPHNLFFHLARRRLQYICVGSNEECAERRNTEIMVLVQEMQLLYSGTLDIEGL